MTRVVMAGVSTRAAAESAARAGFDVTAIDGYADRDQHPGVNALSLPRDFGVPFTAGAAARAAGATRCDAVAYLSNFENNPSLVSALAAGRALWGNPPDVLRRVRNPFTWTAALRARGVAVPSVRDPNDPDDPNDSNDWLVKPLSSGGGHGVRRWRQGTAVPRRCYLQRYVEGTPGSVVFVAARGRAMPLGVSRQIVGNRRFGARGFHYCGSILAPAGDPHFDRGQDLARTTALLAQTTTEEFGLVGVNGIDFVARAGVPYPVEINPRWTASMELVERAHGVSVFGGHAAACSDGRLPPHGLHHAPTLRRAIGKAIVFAREGVRIGNTDGWLANPDVRDVPHAGDRVAAGGPVCTVLAEADEAAACYAALVTAAEHIYEDLARWTKEAA